MAQVLILSASTGGGHNSAANAIKDELEKLGCEAFVVDALKFASPVLDKIISEGYEKSAKYTPQAFGAFYKITGISRKQEAEVFLRRMMGRKILRLIQEKKPGVIICTHPFPTMALMKYKDRGIIDMPIISILTDYTAHPVYIQRNVDAYIVGDIDVSYVLKNSGVDMEKIYPYGIPVSNDFLNTERVDEVKAKLGLEDKFTVLLMGGSFGAGNMKDCFLELLDSSYDFQIVVITGRDLRLKSKFERILSEVKINKKVVVLGFTKDMPELLSIGDVLVTKPGGLTTTEAIIKGIPMVIPYYIPGQEAENVDFLLNNGLALKTFKNYSLSTIIEILIDNPSRRQEITERMRSRSKADSSYKTAKLAIELMK